MSKEAVEDLEAQLEAVLVRIGKATTEIDQALKLYFTVINGSNLSSEDKAAFISYLTVFLDSMIESATEVKENLSAISKTIVENTKKMYIV